MKDNVFRRFIPRSTTLSVVLTGIMIAAEIVLERLIPIVNSGYMKVNLAFLPMAAVAILYGPLYCGAAWAMTDLIGALLFPTGTYFPGFTLNQFLAGVIFGLLLYRIHLSDESGLKSVVRCVCAVIPHIFVIGLFLGTYWLTLLYGSGYLALLPLRFTSACINFGIEAVSVPALALFMKKRKKSFRRAVG